MKGLLLAISLLMSAGIVFGQYRFCIEVDDVCCDTESGSGTIWMNAGDEINGFYLHYETQNKAAGVSVYCTVDGNILWSRSGLCDCGEIYVPGQLRGEHEIVFHVKCDVCSMPPCPTGLTARVWIKSPQTVSRDPECDDPTEP